MIKCPFCHFDNEDGALFCEQCKSDLAGVPSMPAPAKAPPAHAPAVVPAVPVAEMVPMSATPMMAEAIPMSATPMMAEAIPMSATPMVAEAIPMAPGTPVEAYPVAEASPVGEPFPMAPILEPLGFEPIDFSAPHPAPAEPAIEVFPAAEAHPAPMPVAEAVPPAPAPPPVVEAIAIPAPAPPPTPAPVVSAPPPVPEPAPAPAAAAAAPAAGPALPAGAQPRLVVLRGQKRNVEYPLYEGVNFIGRADEKPVDVDLEDQEPPDRIWTSRQHACISFEDGQLAIEDLNSANGTYVNRARVYPGGKRPLAVNDIVQIGTVQLKVLA